MTKIFTADELEVHPLNVRKTVDKAALAELKADILAHSLLQGLVVTGEKSEGYFVVAGGRRLTAIKELINERLLDRNFPIPCEAAKEEEVEEISLSENFTRLALKPIEEFRAFEALSKKGLTPADIGPRFGKSARYVEGRLRLAGLAPKVLAALEKGEITLEHAMAFTICFDVKKQTEALKNFNPGYDDVGDIHRALMGDKLTSNDPIVKFIGLKDYEAAGGNVTKDLFGEEFFIEDITVLEKLALEKLEATKKKAEKEGWGWVEIITKNRYEAAGKYGREYGKPNAKTKKLMGAIVSIGHDGKAEIEGGYIKKEDVAKLKKADPTSTATKAKGKVKGEMTKSLLKSLEEQRLQVQQVALASNPQIAYDLVVYILAEKVLQDDHTISHSEAITLSASEVYIGEELAETPARVAMDEILESLNMAWAKAKSSGERFLILSELSPAIKAKILAACVGLSLKPGLYTDRLGTAVETALNLTDFDLRSVWTPTKDNYFSAITTDQLIAIGEQIFTGKEFPEGVRKEKKPKLVELLHKVFANPDAYTKEVQERIKSWTPEGMALHIAKPKKTKAA